MKSQKPHNVAEGSKWEHASQLRFFLDRICSSTEAARTTTGSWSPKKLLHSPPTNKNYKTIAINLISRPIDYQKLLLQSSGMLQWCFLRSHMVKGRKRLRKYHFPNQTITVNFNIINFGNIHLSSANQSPEGASKSSWTKKPNTFQYLARNVTPLST